MMQERQQSQGDKTSRSSSSNDDVVIHHSIWRVLARESEVCWTWWTRLPTLSPMLPLICTPFPLCQVSARNRRVGSMFHASCLSTRSLAQDRGGLCAIHVMSRAETGLSLLKTFGALDFDRALPLVDLDCYQQVLNPNDPKVKGALSFHLRTWSPKTLL